MKINLVSDTVAKPSQEMSRAMFRAEVSDDFFKQDPKVSSCKLKLGCGFDILNKKGFNFI